MLLVASTLWSISGLIVKLANMDPVSFAMFRSLFAGIGMAGIVLFVSGRLPELKWMALAVIFHTAVVTLLITAMTRDTAASGILLQYTGPIWCAVLAWLVQGRTISRRTLVALIIAAIGIFIMIFLGERSRGWVGPICGLLSGIAFGALILTLERIDRDKARPVNPIAIVMFNNLGTAVLLLPIVLIFGGWITPTPYQFALVAFCGVVQLALPYVLFQLALRRVHPVDASLLILLEPVLNPVWVWLGVGERPGYETFLGGAAILIAMVIEAMKPKQN